MTFDGRNILSISIYNLDSPCFSKFLNHLDNFAYFDYLNLLNHLDYLDYFAFLDAKPT